MKRSYSMYCGLAKALDLLGERWTLLVVRELITGPKRFKDLLHNLPGIGTNLLSKRLKGLERAGVLQRTTLPPPAGSDVYQLTERGLELEPALLVLGRWGTPLLGKPKPSEVFRPLWALLPLKDRFNPRAARGINQTYEFRVGEDLFHVRVAGGRCLPAQGPGWHPDLIVQMSEQAFLEVASQQLTPVQALEQGKVKIQGTKECYLRFFTLFDVPSSPTAGRR